MQGGVRLSHAVQSPELTSSCLVCASLGSVYMFEDGNVTALSPLDLNDFDGFGAAISVVSPSQVVIGAPGQDDGVVYYMYESVPAVPITAPSASNSQKSSGGVLGLQQFEVVIVAVSVCVVGSVLLLLLALCKYKPDVYSKLYTTLLTSDHRDTPSNGVVQMEPTEVKVAPSVESNSLSLIDVESNQRGASLGTSLLDSKAMVRHRWSIERSDLTLDQKSPALGTGGYGVVRRGWWKDGSRRYDVAIKVLSAGVMASGSAKEELIREADMMVSLRSPFIVQLYGMCLDETGHLLVMELMGAGSLMTFLHSQREGHTPSLALRVQMLQDVIRGLEVSSY